MANYEGHAAKRLKTEPNGFGGGHRGRGNPVYGANKPQANYSFPPAQKLDRPPHSEYGRAEEAPNNVLLFTVVNPQYPITVDVMHTICSANGKVDKIVIFKKQGVQAMVEFEAVDSAQRAKQALQGADIYSGCCTLKVEFARTSRLNVTRNDTDSWDYTNPNLGQETERRNALLPDPGPPGQYGMEPRGREPPYERYGGRPSDPYPPPPRDRYAPQDNYGAPPRNDHYGRGPPPGEDHYRRGPPPPGDRYGRGGPRQHDPYRAGGDHEPLSTGMGQQGAVLMLYGLNNEKVNCVKLFNLFCLYGNVVRIKFLKSKEGTAMVQMGDPGAMERALENLNGSIFFDNKLMLSYSKQAFLQDVPNPVELPDSSMSFKDFMGNRNNRFQTPEAASKNRIQSPAKTLYYWNAPPGFVEDALNEIFESNGVKRPAKIKIFPPKSEKSSTGLVEWDTKDEAIEAIMCCNHKDIENPKGKYPYTVKMCFSSNNITTPHPGGGMRRPMKD